MMSTATRWETPYPTSSVVIYDDPDSRTGKSIALPTNRVVPYDPPQEFKYNVVHGNGTGLLDENNAFMFLELLRLKDRAAVEDVLDCVDGLIGDCVSYDDADAGKFYTDDVSIDTCHVMDQISERERSFYFARNIQREDLMNTWTRYLRSDVKEYNIFVSNKTNTVAQALVHDQKPLFRSFDVKECTIVSSYVMEMMLQNSFLYPSKMRRDLYDIWRETYDSRLTRKRVPLGFLIWESAHYSCLHTMDGIHWIHTDPLPHGTLHAQKADVFLGLLTETLRAESPDIPDIVWAPDHSLKPFPGAGFMRQYDSITCLIVSMAYMFYCLDTNGAYYPFMSMSDGKLIQNLYDRMRYFSIRLPHWVERAKQDTQAAIRRVR